MYTTRFGFTWKSPQINTRSILSLLVFSSSWSRPYILSNSPWQQPSTAIYSLGFSHAFQLWLFSWIPSFYTDVVESKNGPSGVRRLPEMDVVVVVAVVSHIRKDMFHDRSLVMMTLRIFMLIQPLLCSTKKVKFDYRWYDIVTKETDPHQNIILVPSSLIQRRVIHTYVIQHSIKQLYELQDLMITPMMLWSPLDRLLVVFYVYSLSNPMTSYLRILTRW